MGTTVASGISSPSVPQAAAGLSGPEQRGQDGTRSGSFSKALEQALPESSRPGQLKRQAGRADPETEASAQAVQPPQPQAVPVATAPHLAVQPGLADEDSGADQQQAADGEDPTPEPDAADDGASTRTAKAAIAQALAHAANAPGAQARDETESGSGQPAGKPRAPFGKDGIAPAATGLAGSPSEPGDAAMTDGSEADDGLPASRRMGPAAATAQDMSLDRKAARDGSGAMAGETATARTTPATTTATTAATTAAAPLAATAGQDGVTETVPASDPTDPAIAAAQAKADGPAARADRGPPVLSQLTGAADGNGLPSAPQAAEGAEADAGTTDDGARQTQSSPAAEGRAARTETGDRDTGRQDASADRQVARPQPSPPPAAQAQSIAPLADSGPTSQFVPIITAPGPQMLAAEVAQKVAAQTHAPGTSVPIHGLAIAVAARAAAGSTRFDIRLDPPELGRIEVQLILDREGSIRSRMVVEKQETLDLLQRDQRNLERALAQAGVEAKEGSIEFSLRDQGGHGRERPQHETARLWHLRENAEDAPSSAAHAAEIQSRLAALRGGVDIRI